MPAEADAVCRAAYGVSAPERINRRNGYGPRDFDTHNGACWFGFIQDLTARGVTGVRLVTSDTHAGIVAAISAILPGAAWQRLVDREGRG